jgi:general secretion pathway protein N
MSPTSRFGLLVGAGVTCGALMQLLLEMPAGALQAVARWASQGQLELAEPSGGLLDGSATLAWRTSQHRGPPVPLGRWAWSAAWPPAQGPGWRVSIGGGPLQGGFSLALGWNHLSVSELQLRIEAAALPAGWAGWDLLHASGEFVLASERLRISGAGVSGAGTLDWRDAATSLVSVAPLGAWRADWLLEGQQGSARLSTRAGPLHVEGTVRFALDGRGDVHGRVWSEPGSAAALEPALRLLGPLREDGSAALELSWPPG